MGAKGGCLLPHLAHSLLISYPDANPPFPSQSPIQRTQSEGSLGAIDALLGCPIVLFDPELATDGDAWASLPGPGRLAALTALFHSVAWLRETINCFAPQVGAGHSLIGAAAWQPSGATVKGLTVGTIAKGPGRC